MGTWHVEVDENVRCNSQADPSTGPAAPNHRCRRRSLGAVCRTLRAMHQRVVLQSSAQKGLQRVEPRPNCGGSTRRVDVVGGGHPRWNRGTRYTTRPLIDGVEIRRYGPRIAAETTVAADEEAARSAGFRRLAGYIFGGNHQVRRIAMTAPVAEQVDRAPARRSR